jgi:hypothetical protein
MVLLAEGVLNTMLFTKAKVAMVLMVVAGLTSALALVNLALAAEEPAKKNRNAKTGTLLLARGDALVALTPDGKEETKLTAPMNTGLGLEARLSNGSLTRGGKCTRNCSGRTR